MTSSECWRNFTLKTEIAVSGNAKSFRSFVNNIRNENSEPISSFHENMFVTDGSAIADLFAEYFESVYSESDLRYHDTGLESIVDIANLDISFVKSLSVLILCN